VCNKTAENGDVTNFTPTAKIEGTWVIFFLPSFVLYFPTRKSTGTPTRDLGFGREVAFCFGSALLGNFARGQLHAFLSNKKIGLIDPGSKSF
jgi:hypothetical protein